jgi:DNA-binding CsgD family transcriptional regulator
VKFEQDLPFAGLHQLISPLLAEVDSPSTEKLDIALGMADGERPSQQEIADSLSDLIANATDNGPILLIVDDLQWFDPPSAMVLETAVARLRGHRVGVLVSTRDGIGHFNGIPVHTVAPLRDDAAEEILRTRFPTLGPHVRARLIGEAQGNPLALLELPLALSSDQRTGNSGLPETLRLSERLQSLFVTRAAALPEPTRRLLLLAALDGSASLSIFDSDQETPELIVAARVGLVTVDREHDRLVFRDPLIRSAVVEMSTNDERNRAHAELAARLADQPDRHAWHRAHAVVEPDEHIAALLEQLALRSRDRGDAAGAVDALLRAAELSPSNADRGRRLVDAAYTGSLAGGQLRSVPRLLDDAQRCGTGRDATPPLALAVAAAHHLLFSDEGDIDTAHRLLVGALDMRPGSLNATDYTVVEALNTLSLIAYFGGRADLWDAFHRIAARLEPGLPGPLALLAATLADPARTTPRTLMRLDEAIAALDCNSSPADVVRTSVAGIFVDRLPACRQPLRQLGHRPGADHAGTVRLHMLSLLGLERFMAGAWDETAALADEHVRLADELGYGLLRCLGRYLQAMVAAGRGDGPAVTALTEQMVGWAAPRRATLILQLAAHARTLLALGRGDYESAYRHGCAASAPGVLASHAPYALWFVTDLTEAAVRTGRRAEAQAHVAAAHAANLAAISPRYGLLMDIADAMIAPEKQAPAQFAEALNQPGMEQWPFEHARALLVHGERLRRARMNRKARVQLVRASEIFARMGADVWRARAEREAKATEVSPTASLTAQQRVIVELAAAGLTNKQIAERLFLSARTVGTHLYQTFPKLGVTSRAGLRDALRQLPHTDQSELP